MNAHDAFERHTSLVHALTQTNGPARAHFTQVIARIARNLTGDPVPAIMLGDQDVLIRRHHEQGHVDTAMVLAWSPHADEAIDPDATVGVVDPAALQAGFGLTAAADLDPEAARDAVLVPTELMPDLTAHQFAAAPTFYVTADMCALLDHAARQLDGTDVMPYHPAHPVGFVVLARPLELPWGDGTTQYVHAFAWTEYGLVGTNFGGTGHTGLVWQFTDRVAAPDDPRVREARTQFPSKRAWADSPRLVPVVADRYTTGTPVGPPAETPAAAEHARQAMLDALNAADTDDTTGSTGSTEAAASLYDGQDEVGRFQPYLAAFLLLLTQQITDARPSPVPAPTRARATNAGRSARTETVTVVDLHQRGRHGEPGAGGRTGRHYTTRHPVGGHWKWQPYGPDRALRRRIFVEGYIRGPEDAPLVVKPRVRRL